MSERYKIICICLSWFLAAGAMFGVRPIVTFFSTGELAACQDVPSKVGRME